ncbi:MAG: protoheme IX farnesyltransferase, partial [Rubripirellula sp.]
MATDLLPAESASLASPENRSPTFGGATCESVAITSAKGQGSAVGVLGTGSLESDESKQATVEGKSYSVVLSDYVQLTKPRIVVMILVTTCATAMIGAGGWVSAPQLLWLLMGTAAIAGSAGAANQVWERVIDCRMTRTANRPIPSGRVGALPATLFTAILGLFGAAVLTIQFGLVPAGVGVATWALYVLVYTPMKTRTAWNTTVGAVAGAIPVLIGYTAMGGSLMDWTGWLLVGVLVAWQYPHFMSIAWMYRRQYGEAGFRMTTTEEPTGRSAGWQSILGSLALMACGVTLCCLPTGWLPAAVTSLAVIASAWPMLKASVRFAKSPDDIRARKLLRSSLLV